MYDDAIGWTVGDPGKTSAIRSYHQNAAPFSNWPSVKPWHIWPLPDIHGDGKARRASRTSAAAADSHRSSSWWTAIPRPSAERPQVWQARHQLRSRRPSIKSRTFVSRRWRQGSVVIRPKNSSTSMRIYQEKNCCSVSYVTLVCFGTMPLSIRNSYGPIFNAIGLP